MRLVLFEPEIPQNTGTLLRLAACLGVAVELIEPCGFLLSDRRLRRAGMDYLAHAAFHRYASWSQYREMPPTGRLILLSSEGAEVYTEFTFRRDDRLLLGRESDGVPSAVAAEADDSVRIPMLVGRRSINLALAAAMVLGEALRQTRGFPIRNDP